MGDEFPKVCSSVSFIRRSESIIFQQIHPHFRVESALCKNEGDLTRYPCSFLRAHLFDQTVQVQHARNVRILDLVRVMGKTYSFVVSVDELKRHPVLQDIMKKY